MEARPVLILSLIVVLLMMLPGQTIAYDDALGAHSKINSIALSNFRTEIMPGDPYLKNASLDNTPCVGIAWDPTDGDRINPPEIAIQRVKPLYLWVIDGGYSADEPEGTMALCHFYDPTQPAGKRYLTDQQFIVNFVSKFNSEYANPEIDAVQWAFHGDQYGTVFDQQFSWDQGKSYLKKALESSDPYNVNYGKAWRSLGETMHLMADMTVPAHVRNDGHAKALNNPDPYETSTTWELVDQNKGFAPASDINYAQNPEQLMVSVANYTNSHFLSKDTIPLPPGISSPWHKYTLPSVEGLTPSPMGYLYQNINGESIRIAKTRSLWSYTFDTGKQQYMIDDQVCNDQRKVLIPTAIKADEVLVSDFLPRFKVAAQVSPATIGGSYTMTGGIKGIYSGEWPEISSVKIRNGARIVVEDAKTGEETKISVKLPDPSGDYNSFSYDFSANPGDIVRLEYYLGGYVVKSDNVIVPETIETQEEVTFYVFRTVKPLGKDPVTGQPWKGSRQPCNNYTVTIQKDGKTLDMGVEEGVARGTNGVLTLSLFPGKYSYQIAFSYPKPPESGMKSDNFKVVAGGRNMIDVETSQISPDLGTSDGGRSVDSGQSVDSGTSVDSGRSVDSGTPVG